MLAYLEGNDVDTRVVRLALPDFAGNLIDYVYGPQGRTYYDDRFDMFPEDVTRSHRAFFVGGPSLREGLDDEDIDLAGALSTASTVQILAGDPEWRVLYVDDQWTLLCRRQSELGGTLGTC